MPFLGEILALCVAILWTVSSLAAESASRHYGSSLFNILRMIEAILMIGLVLWVFTGSPLPLHATHQVWFYLALSSFAGYIIGDFFFLQCFILIGARWGELFMTIAPLAAALTGWMLLGEEMTYLAWLGMLVTTTGICMSVLSKGDDSQRKRQVKIKLPVRGVIYGLIAGIGQGVGLVLSKIGMMHYRESISQASLFAHSESLLHYDLLMPFAATLIRCLVALVGFILMYTIARAVGKESHKLSLYLQNRRIFGLATLSTICGPFIGVALSLAATLFTTTGITQTIMSLVPVLILYPSHLLFKTKITPTEVVGAIISVCGVALFFI